MMVLAYGTIGSPGRNFGSVTVGATYNNLTSSLVATLEVNEKTIYSDSHGWFLQAGGAN